MKTQVTCLLLLFWVGLINAQTDSLPAELNVLQWIVFRRAELKNAIQLSDVKTVKLQMDSLLALKDSDFEPLVWDERWLLYHQLGLYPILLEELRQYTPEQRLYDSWKISCSSDGLFELLDSTNFQHQDQLLTQIQASSLAPEEQAFLTLHLAYLLRSGQEKLNNNLEDFAKQYPNSRFKPFINQFMYTVQETKPGGVGLNFGFLSGNWLGPIESHISQLYAVNVGAEYWRRRFHVMVNAYFGKPQIEIPVFSKDGYPWPKEDPVIANFGGLAIGYDLVDNEKLRIFPNIGVGISQLKPPLPEEGEPELPVYYGDFFLKEWSFTAALNADLKFKFHSDADETQKSYHGLRMSVGYQALHYESNNEDLAGNMIFFALNYKLFSRPKHQKPL